MRTDFRSHICLLGVKMKVKSNKEIFEFCDKIAKEVGVRLIEVEFKQGKNPALTLFIDKDGGMDLDTCELYHNAINEPLDELDPTFGAPYTLNVSSPGADRPFKTEEDFNANVGKMVEVKLYSAIKGKKFYEGELLSYNGQCIVIKADKKTTLSIDMKNIVKVNKYIDFN